MAYVCPQCRRSTKLPDFCCGRSMVSRGSYVCPTCGKSAGTPGTCCDQQMFQV